MLRRSRFGNGSCHQHNVLFEAAVRRLCSPYMLRFQARDQKADQARQRLIAAGGFHSVLTIPHVAAKATKFV